jgi:hypothetical protein
MTTIALFGAAGKMGARIRANLQGEAAYKVLCVESPAGQERLRAEGVEPVPAREAVASAEAIILAVPDALIGQVAREQVVPFARAGALIICLDPAAPFAGVLPAREDIAYFVVHPCHPAVFQEENDPEKRRDFFGGCGQARQNIVCALVQGQEADYARGEAIARRIFHPVLRAHRLTLEQMVLLEPVLTESIAAPCLSLVREAYDEVVRRGVPPLAARDFLLGHIRINLAMFFGEADIPLSDGAKLAVSRGRERLFRPDWRALLEPEAIRSSVQAIVRGESAE